MDEVIRAFGQSLADAALARNWEGVHEMLAPWLQRRYSVAQVQEFFESNYREILKAGGVSELHYPEIPYVSGNSSTLAYLREKPSWQPGPRPIPAEVTDANFRFWMNIQLQCSEDQAAELDLDYLADIWLIVVAHGAGLRVGYWARDAYESEA